MKNYTEFPNLENVYLPDSYVLAIREDDDRVIFALDVVLRPEHERYHPPKPGEHHCYAEGNLVFDGATRVHWLKRTEQVFTDPEPDGDTDLGSIDSLVYRDDHYEIMGDFGDVHIYTSHPPRLVLH